MTAPSSAAPVAAADWNQWSTGVRVAVTRPEAVGAVETLLRRVMHQVGCAASRFDPDSEVHRLTSGRWVRVTPLLWTLVDVALSVAERTSGAVDPTVGASLEALGYDETITAVRTRDPDAHARIRVRRPSGWRSVGRDHERHMIRVPRGTVLDLGATAKAWAADTAAIRASIETDSGVLVAIGGDIAVAGPAPEGGWSIRIADDHRDGDGDAPRVSISDGGLATSSVTTRNWQIGADWLHHIVDPATGHPVRPVWRTATVAAGSCVDANAAATAALVLGVRATSWLRSAGLPARLVDPAGNVSVVGGWPQ